jgi:hypothetical protein
VHLSLPKKSAVWLAVLIVLVLPLLPITGTVALAQEGGGDPMQMTPEGAGENPDEAPEATDDAPNLGGPNTGMTNDRMEEEADKEAEEEEAKENGEAPPTEDCGMTDITCMTNNALITFVWWIIRAPMLFIQELITGFEGMGFALPDPSGPLMEKYDQVAEKVRPMVLVGMLVTGGLMLARSANYNTAYLLQSGLPRIGLAVLGLAFFPQFAKLIADISNGLASSFYEDTEVTKMFAELLEETIIAEIAAFLAVLLTPASWGILGIMALVFLGPVLVLVLLLFVITYMNGLFFSLLIMTGPIALVCYAVPGLQSVTEVWFKGILASAVLPIIFSIEIMLMSWAGGNPEAIGPAGGTASIVVCVLLLWVMVKTPGKVYHWAFGSMGGGGGGGFLAGMGMRSLLRKGLQVAGGAATGGAAAAAGAAAGAAGGGAALGGGKAGVGAVARKLGESAHGDWGAGRLKQHKAGHDFKKTLANLQGSEGALKAIRQSGEFHLGAQNKIADLESQVLGGKMSRDEAEKQAQALLEDQAANKENLAANLAESHGGDSQKYKDLMVAEESSQEQGLGSQVGTMESPQAPRSAMPDEKSSGEPAQPTETDRLQEYTARLTSDETPGTETTTAQLGEEGRTDRISGDASDAGAVNASAGERPQDTFGRNAVSEVGEPSYSPPKLSQGLMDDEEKAKAEKIHGMLASNPEAQRSYKRALADDKKMRNQQGRAHHEAMRGTKSSDAARQSVDDIQKNRDKNLKAAAQDLAKRYHNSPAKPGAGAGPPITENDMRRILRATFDYAYDEPHNQQGGQAPSYGRYFEEKISGSNPDGNLDGAGNGNVGGGSEGRYDGPFVPGTSDKNRDPQPPSEDTSPRWEVPERE